MGRDRIAFSRSSVLILALLGLGLFQLGCDPGGSGQVVVPELPVAEVPQKNEAEKEEPGEAPRELVKAEANVSGKADFAKDGHKSVMAPITVPLGSYFTMRERMVFNVQVPEAMKLYKAQNDNKGPASHEEYMEKIIRANNIKLPSLKSPEHQYVYDPETGDLMVSQPAQ